MTAITTVPFFFFRSVKHKQICLVAIVKQVCLPMNGNEQKVVLQVDHNAQ